MTAAAKFGDGRLPERFWVKVAETADGCWQWIAHQTHDGYGEYSVAGRHRYAHRVAYAALVGPIQSWQPGGMVLDHLCRNRACVNPAHLESVTHRENVLRGEGPAADASRRTHCPKGHPYAGDNLDARHLQVTGHRKCRTCKRGRNATHSAAIKAARTALGLTQRDYVAQFGRSRAVAEAIAASAEINSRSAEAAS